MSIHRDSGRKRKRAGPNTFRCPVPLTSRVTYVVLALATTAQETSASHYCGTEAEHQEADACSTERVLSAGGRQRLALRLALGVAAAAVASWR
ncbi:hypothetical protein ACFPRL_12515 [Pseudoclavibacter helvolus]